MEPETAPGADAAVVYLSGPAFAALAALADTTSQPQRRVVEILAAYTYIAPDDLDARMARAAGRSPRTQRVRLHVGPETLRGLEAAGVVAGGQPSAGAGLDAIMRELVTVEGEGDGGLEDLVPTLDPRGSIDVTQAAPIDLRIYLSKMAARSVRTLVMEMSEWKARKQNLAGLMAYLADPGITYRPSGQELRAWPRTDRRMSILPSVARRFVDIGMANGFATPANRRVRPLVGHTLEAIGQGVLVAVVTDTGAAYNARGIHISEGELVTC